MLFLTSLLVGLAACSGDESLATERTAAMPGKGVIVQQDEEGVAGLPYARGRRFRSLDEYLAYMKEQSAIDLPWWREIRPGVYEYVVSIRGAPRKIATRAELMAQYGFSR